MPEWSDFHVIQNINGSFPICFYDNNGPMADLFMANPHGNQARKTPEGGDYG